MTFRPGLSRSDTRAAAAVLALLAMVGTAWPQSAPQQPSLGVHEQPQAAPQAQQAPPPPDNPGLIHEIGKLIDKITPSVQSPSETIGDINARAKDAGDALSRLAKPGGMVTGRTI